MFINLLSRFYHFYYFSFSLLSFFIILPSHFPHFHHPSFSLLYSLSPFLLVYLISPFVFSPPPSYSTINFLLYLSCFTTFSPNYRFLPLLLPIISFYVLSSPASLPLYQHVYLLFTNQSQGIVGCGVSPHKQGVIGWMVRPFLAFFFSFLSILMFEFFYYMFFVVFFVFIFYFIFNFLCVFFYYSKLFLIFFLSFFFPFCYMFFVV